MHGLSAIYSFPFRVHGNAGLLGVEHKHTDDGSRYRVALFHNTPSDKPLRLCPPIQTWPNFAWSSAAPASEQILPPSDLCIRFYEDVYDAMRVDVWALDPDKAVQRFSHGLVAWLRHLTMQSWIGDVESQSETSLKFSFSIDATGGALKSPFTNMGFTTPNELSRPASIEILAEACRRAAAGDEVPAHWALWLDAQNYRSRGQVVPGTIAFALSLEVARNTLFPRFAKTESKPGLGAVLRPPFDGTDLLRHLSTALDTAIGRSFQRELPEHWDDVKALYTARHHAAHGRSPLYRRPAGLHRVADEDLHTWTTAVRGTLQWMESLPTA